MLTQFHIKEKTMEISKEKIAEIINGGAAKVSKKASETKDILVAKYNISKLKDDLDELYIKLGMLVNDAYNAPGTTDEEEVSALNDEINAKIAEIDAAKDELRDLSGKCVCFACKKEIADDALFCPYCGAKVNIEEN